MIEDPDRWAPEYAEAGRRQRDLPRRGGRTRRCGWPASSARRGARAGLALRPATPVEPLRRPARRDRHGARHDRRARLRRAGVPRRRAAEDPPRPRADRARAASTSGSRSTAGSSAETIERCAEAGADVFVAGSAVYGADDPTGGRRLAHAAPVTQPRHDGASRAAARLSSQTNTTRAPGSVKFRTGGDSPRPGSVRQTAG